MDLQSVWGWQPALYLFLGGMGAGAFVTAAILYVRDRARGLVVCAAMWAAVASLVCGLLLLLMELVSPARGLLMWQSFSNFGSWMTYGAWGAFCAIVVFGVSALLATEPFAAWLCARAAWYARREKSIRRVLAVAGIVLGLFVAFYTGMLLMAPSTVPFWSTPLLPALFTVSALDTGVALVEVVSVALAKRESLEARAMGALERAVVVLALVEVAVLAVLVGTSLGSDARTPAALVAAVSAETLVFGSLAPWFWALVVGIGLALPLGVAARALVRSRGKSEESTSDTVEENCSKDAPNASREHVATAVGAAGALVGGCTLRFIVLAAGVHADLVAATILGLIG